MSFEQGIYEQLITKIIANKLDALDNDAFYIKTVALFKPVFIRDNKIRSEVC